MWGRAAAQGLSYITPGTYFQQEPILSQLQVYHPLELQVGTVQSHGVLPLFSLPLVVDTEVVLAMGIHLLEVVGVAPMMQQVRDGRRLLLVELSRQVMLSLASQGKALPIRSMSGELLGVPLMSSLQIIAMVILLLCVEARGVGGLAHRLAL